MGRLISRLFVLGLLVAAAVALGATGVFGTWWYGLIGAGIFLVVLAAAPALIPGAMGALGEGERRSGAAALQVFGSLCALMILVMGLVTWAYGNRSLGNNNAYQVLGLIIFLLLIGVGIQGAVATLARFSYIWSRDHPPQNRRLAHR